MTKAKAGTKSRLSALHAMFTEALIEELTQSAKENIPLPAADKSVIAKFLKDNDITADADDSKMNTLRETFEDELAAKREERARQILGNLDKSGDDLSKLGII